MKSLHETLKEMNAMNQNLLKAKVPFTEREKAKAELVFSLLKKVEAGEIKA